MCCLGRQSICFRRRWLRNDRKGAFVTSADFSVISLKPTQIGHVVRVFMCCTLQRSQARLKLWLQLVVEY